MAPSARARVLQFPNLLEAGLRHGFTTLAAGDFSHAAAETEAGREALRGLGEVVGFDPDLVVSAEQVHGDTVAVVHLCENCGPGRRIPHTDGLISEEPWPLLIATADCFPVILYEPREAMVAVLHCGWRGTVAGILPRAVARLVRESGAGPSGMYAGIGPGICGACYEVGQEVVQAARRAGLGSHVSADADLAHHRLDIAGALRAQLLDAGFRPERVESAGRCTFEDAEFPSHRRDGTPVRMATVAVVDR
jgi:YfiH family protein